MSVGNGDHLRGKHGLTWLSFLSNLPHPRCVLLGMCDKIKLIRSVWLVSPWNLRGGAATSPVWDSQDLGVRAKMIVKGDGGTLFDMGITDGWR